MSTNGIYRHMTNLQMQSADGKYNKNQWKLFRIEAAILPSTGRANAAWSSDGLCWNYFFFFTIPIPISKALMRIPATRRITYTLAFTLRSVVQVEKFAWRMVSCLVSYRR